MSWSFWIYSISSFRSSFFFLSLSLPFFFFSTQSSFSPSNWWLSCLTKSHRCYQLQFALSHNWLCTFKIMHICKSVLKYYNLIFYSRFPSRSLDLPLENWFLFFFFSFRSTHYQTSESHFTSTTRDNVFSGKGKEEKGREHGQGWTWRVI